VRAKHHISCQKIAAPLKTKGLQTVGVLCAPTAGKYQFLKVPLRYIILSSIINYSQGIKSMVAKEINKKNSNNTEDSDEFIYSNGSTTLIWEDNILSSDEPIENIFTGQSRVIEPQDNEFFSQSGKNITTFSEIDDLFTQDSQSPSLEEEFFSENEEEGPIALSDEELETALSDIPEAMTPPTEDTDMSDFDYSESPPLSLEETEDDISESIPEGFETDTETQPEPLSATQEEFFTENEEEGPIALSDEELETALSDIPEEITPSTEDTDMSDFDFSETPPLSLEETEGDISDSIPEGFETDTETQSEPLTATQEEFFTENEEEGPIALSDEELETALSDIPEEITPSTEDTDMSDFDFSETPPLSLEETEGDISESIPEGFETDTETQPEPLSATQEEFFTENEEEGPIALSDEELETALSDIPAEMTTSTEDTDMSDFDFSESPTISPEETQGETTEFSMEDFESETQPELQLEEIRPEESGEHEEPEKLESEPVSATEEEFFNENEEEGPIALSDEELETALSDIPEEITPSTEDTDMSDFDFTESPTISPEETQGETTEFSMEDFESETQPELQLEEIRPEESGEHEEPEKLESEPLSATQEEFFTENEEEGPIALSDEELETALSDISEEITPSTEDTDMSDFDFSETPPLTLEETEGDISESIPEGFETDTETQPEPVSATQEEFFTENEEEVPIALSDEELETALSDIPEEITPSTEDTDISDFDFTISPEEYQQETAEGNDIEESENKAEEQIPSTPGMEEQFFNETEEESPIALSDEELETALAETDSMVFSDEDLEKTSDIDIQVVDDIENQPPITEIQETEIKEEPGISNMTQKEDEWEIEISPDEYPAPEKEIQNLDKEGKISDEEGKVNFFDEKNINLPNRDELKKVVAYLDNLLGELPDEIIEKFAKSEYFRLYQKIMDDLGL
jgi:hypothetical protein